MKLPLKYKTSDLEIAKTFRKTEIFQRSKLKSFYLWVAVAYCVLQVKLVICYWMLQFNYKV